MKIYKIDVYIFLRRNSIEFFIEFNIWGAIGFLDNSSSRLGFILNPQSDERDQTGLFCGPRWLFPSLWVHQKSKLCLRDG